MSGPIEEGVPEQAARGAHRVRIDFDRGRNALWGIGGGP